MPCEGRLCKLRTCFQGVLSLALGGLDIRMVPSKAVIVFFPFWLLTFDILPSLKAGDSRFLVGGFAFRGDRSPSGCALR